MSLIEFELSAAEADLRDAVRRLLSDHAGPQQRRAHLDPAGDHDPRLWTMLARDMGLTGLTIDEKYGGSGATAADLAVVMHELGRSLAATPFFSTAVLAAGAISACDDEAAKHRWLPGIADGSTVAALAYADLAGEPVTATATPRGWRLSGTKRHVVHGAQAGLLVVSATAADGRPALFAVEATSPAVQARRRETLDLTRPLADITLTGSPAEPLGAAGDGARILRTALDWASVALGAEMVGVIEASLEMAVDYAKIRVQFGRPIGSFQAVKHKLANMYVDLELSRAVVRHAALSAAADPRSVAASAELVLAQVSDSCSRAVAELLQVMGGVGYTWEHDAQLYFKRGRSAGYLLGTAPRHREAIARRFGL